MRGTAESTRPRPQILLYGRAGCHLCDEARDGLIALHREGWQFDLHEIDIESDEDLHRRLLERIPVVEVEGGLACELGFDPDAVRSRLATVEA